MKVVQDWMTHGALEPGTSLIAKVDDVLPGLKMNCKQGSVVGVLLLCLLGFFVGCGKDSGPGVYENKQDRRGYDRRGDIVVFGETRTLDCRSDGSFVFTYDPGKDAEGYSGGRREVTTGKWEFSGGNVVCYNGDGSIFSTLKRESSDLISGETRYRRK